MHWIFYTFFIKCVVETFFFNNKPIFPKFCDSFNDSDFQAKIATFYY